MKKLLKSPLRIGGQRYPAGAIVDIPADQIEQFNRLGILADASAVDRKPAPTPVPEAISVNAVMQKVLKSPLRIGGQRYPAGAIVDIPADQVEQLDRLGVLADVPADRLPTPVVIEQPPAPVPEMDLPDDIAPPSEPEAGTQDEPEQAAGAPAPAPAKPKKPAKARAK